MAIQKVCGVETEYGITHLGVAEPNPITGRICIRCGADLRPPAPEPPPPPTVVLEPVVVPAPASRRAWPWALLVAAAVVAIVLIVVLGLVY